MKRKNKQQMKVMQGMYYLRYPDPMTGHYVYLKGEFGSAKQAAEAKAKKLDMSGLEIWECPKDAEVEW